jgi:predicted protein tyrosine phosphatase
MSTMNRLANCHNHFQGKYKRVLCVCSAGLLRSPTTALVLSQEPFNYNTRAAGCVAEYALVPVDEVLVDWADEIVCMEPNHVEKIKPFCSGDEKIICLDLPDQFEYRNPDLMRLIRERYEALSTSVQEENL